MNQDSYSIGEISSVALLSPACFILLSASNYIYYMDSFHKFIDHELKFRRKSIVKVINLVEIDTIYIAFVEPMVSK